MTATIKLLPLWRAKKLIGQKERVFVLSHQGVSLPIELLNESALFKATRKKQTEVFIFWSDILHYEVFDHGAGAKPQIRLTLKPFHEYADLRGKIAIFRTPQLDQILGIIETFKSKSV